MVTSRASLDSIDKEEATLPKNGRSVFCGHFFEYIVVDICGVRAMTKTHRVQSLARMSKWFGVTSSIEHFIYD